jgi:hypothetical protein
MLLVPEQRFMTPTRGASDTEHIQEPLGEKNGDRHTRPNRANDGASYREAV